MDFCCSRTKNGELWKTQLSLDYDLHFVMELVWNSRAVCSPLSRIRIVRKHGRRAQHERKSNPEMSGIVISSFSDDLEGCSKSVPPASSTKTFSLIGFSWDPLGIPNHRIACPKRCRGHLDGFLVELHRTSRSRTFFGIWSQIISWGLYFRRCGANHGKWVGSRTSYFQRNFQNVREMDAFFNWKFLFSLISSDLLTFDSIEILWKWKS